MKYCLHRDILYFFVRFLGFLVLLIPFKLTLFIGKSLGVLAYLILKSERQKTIANLQSVFAKEKSITEIKVIARRVFENLGKNGAELLSFPKISSQNIERLITAYGLQKVDRELEKGRGVIMLSSHFGNWELLAAYFGLKGYPSNVISRRPRYQKYEKMLCDLRSKKGVRTIDRSEPPRQALKILREKGLLGIMPDQDVDSLAGVFVDFFGQPTYTPIGPVNLALASKVPIIPCFLIRENGKHKLVVEDPLEMVRTGDKQEDLRVNTYRWSKVTESYIRRYPEQWVWMHERWKTKPNRDNHR